MIGKGYKMPQWVGTSLIFCLGLGMILLPPGPLTAHKASARRSHKYSHGSNGTIAARSVQRAPVSLTAHSVVIGFGTRSWYTTTMPVLWQNEQLCGPVVPKLGDTVIFEEVLFLN